MDALLEEYRDILAPAEPDADCKGAGIECTCPRVEGTVPHGWVLIHEWASLDGDWFDWASRRGMTMTSTLGLVGAVESDIKANLSG
jgi:hypothetical protein